MTRAWIPALGLLAGCYFPFDRPPRDGPMPAPPFAPDGFAPDAIAADAAMVNRNPNTFPGTPGEMVIGNGTGATLVVRVRGLKPTVQLDCQAVAKAPQVWLARALFAPATTWQIDSGRAIGVSGGGRPCTALLVDGGGLPMRLLFWQTDDHPPTTLPSTVEGTQASALLRLQASEDGVDFAKRAEVHPAPPLLDPGPVPGCGQPDPSGDIAWSLPVPLGDQTILELQTAPDGCMHMDLLGKMGVSSWTLCLPPGAFPFEEGDGYFAGALLGGHNMGAIEGFELIADKRKLRFGRGNDVVYFGLGAVVLAPLPGCSGAHDACGGLQAPLMARVTRPGQAEVTVLPGQNLDTGAGGQLHVLQAATWPVLDSACLAGTKLGEMHVQSVFTQVLP